MVTTLDEDLRSRFHALSEKIIDATDAVNRILDAENPTPKEIDECHERVAACITLFNELLALAPAESRAGVERTHGRRLTDLRRYAGRLPARTAGTSVASATDVPEGGGWPFLLQRTPPKSIEAQRAIPRRGEGPHYSAGGEVEAWCGACAGLREHVITAIVSGLPKQVICQACNARHAYRTEPIRSKKVVAAAAAADKAKADKPRKPTPAELEAQKKEQARFALQKELAEATDVRTFSPKLSYKAGEIINHPEHGRGKVENVVRGSILVRFRNGLKALTIY